MSYEEKGEWVYLVVNVLTYGLYLSIILGGAGSTPLAEVDYAPTMLWTIGIGIGLTIAGSIVFEVAKPSDSVKADARDREIHRFGEYFGGTVLAIGMVVPFIFALAEFDHFWIANGMYLAFAVAALTGTIVKLVAYRRGL